jgi:hypothetical protein
MDLLEPTGILPAPEMVPSTRIVVSEDDAAAKARSGRLETLTISPPAPPVVLLFACQRRTLA